MNYPESKAVETWEKDGLRYSLTRHDTMGHFCGYARFPKRPTVEKGYGGILSYAPVHGGITYAHQDDDGMVYGFDCAHAGDEQDPLVKDPVWARAECERMGIAIQEAAKVEAEYLRNDGNNEARAALLDDYVARMTSAGCDEGFNFGKAIRVMSGRL